MNVKTTDDPLSLDTLIEWVTFATSSYCEGIDFNNDSAKKYLRAIRSVLLDDKSRGERPVPPFPEYPGETLETMAEIGEAFMDAMPKGYCWLQSPAEIIADLQNKLDDERASYAAAIAKTVREYAASLTEFRAEIARLKEQGTRHAV